MSSVSSIDDLLAEYAAGRLPAERLVSAVATAYYKGEGRRERLLPVMEVIERAHPGIVELSASEKKPGFAVRLAERPFPKQWEAALRKAAAAAISDMGANLSPLPSPNLFARILQAIRKIFSASA
jgi:hypothetical protein